MSWDGSTRRTWIDGKEVFGGGAAIDGDTGIPILGEWDTTYMLPTDTAHAAPQLSSAILWTRISDDSPFEPPLRTDPPPTIESDIGEGEDLVYSWW